MKCAICHGELPSASAICPGRLPGAVGLVAFSPGPCRSTPADRARVESQRAEAARRELANERVDRVVDT